MRHRKRGRKLGRNPAHRTALLRNLASGLLLSLREYDDGEDGKPKTPGRIITTLAKAKEARPFVEKLVTLARKSLTHTRRADEFATDAERHSPEWEQWRNSDRWQQWSQTIAPALALRRRALALLRNREAVSILFDVVAERFEERPGGYTRVVRLPDRRLGDAGTRAILEFVGERDRIKARRHRPHVETERPRRERKIAAEQRSQAESQASRERAEAEGQPAGPTTHQEKHEQ